ncbi:armadillo-type protein [Cryomyces antarcticus]
MADQQFVRLLESLLAPDADHLKVTSTLNKQYYTSPASLSALLHILVSHQSSQLRQLAAVEARKLATKHWASIPADQKPQIRNQLLQSTLSEENTLVRHSSARVITAIAKIDLEDGEWADLPGYLQQAATSPTVRHREVGVYIIYTLLETMSDMFPENLSAMFTLFGKTIQDPESVEVRINTMLALSELAMVLDTDEDVQSLKAFQIAIPHMVTVLKQTIEAEDEAHTIQAFEVFQKLLGYDAALLNKHFGDLMQFMMDMASNTDIDEAARTQALLFLMQAVRYRKLKVQSLRIGEQLTTKALKIVTEMGDTSSDDDEDATPARSALGLLDILSGSLPPSQVVVPLLKAIGPYVNNQNPDFRRAGILALGMCVEGAPDFIATQLKEILPMVLHLLEDPDVRVRSAALNGVARLSDDLAEDMGKEHARLIPALVKNYDMALRNLQGPHGKESLGIVKASCMAVESLIEGLDPQDAARYVQELVPRFSHLFEHPNFKVKAAAVGAVGSIASACEGAFMPYFAATMQALGPYIPIKDSKDELDLRGAVCDTMGKIAPAVGAVAFESYVRPLMEASEEALHLDHPRLRETSYILWSTMAKVYEEQFAPYLDGVVKGLHECLQQDETKLDVELAEEVKELLGQDVVIAGQKMKVADAENDMDGEDDEDDWDDVGAITDVAMEKEIAIEVVGDVLTHSRGKFLPYFQKTVEIIFPLVQHQYEGVRKSAIGTLWRGYACLWGLAEGSGMEKWKPGIPLQVQPTEDLAKLGNLVMTATLAVWQEEIDRSLRRTKCECCERDSVSDSIHHVPPSALDTRVMAVANTYCRGTVTDINRSLAATFKLCGPAILITENGTAVPEITNQLLSILTKRHPCQQDLGEEDGEDGDVPEESSEYDWLVIETAMDTVTCLAAALGESFGELWKVFEKAVLKYASSQERYERSSAVGTVAECAGNMGTAVTPYTAGLLKVVIHRLSDEDPETKSNAAYATGLICEKSTADAIVLKTYNTIFAKLEPVITGDRNEARLLDNSAGCVSRMIARHPDHVPIAEVLPRLVDLLPLKEDWEENEAVFRMIVGLYQRGDKTVQA